MRITVPPTAGRLWRHWLALVILTATASSAKPVSFNLPAQPAADALAAFAKQARIDVIFPSLDLKGVKSNSVTGDLEPAVAIKSLLEGTGFKAEESSGKFIITKIPTPAGSVRGVLLRPEGGGAGGIRVAVRETGQHTLTDDNGLFAFFGLPSGAYTFITIDGAYQPLHITNVQAKAGQEVLISGQTLRKATDTTKLAPFVVVAEAVTELDQYEVTDTRAKPFSGGNVDLPRTINDAQPYTIFDAQTLEQSGATNVEDFLKQRLTMNATGQTNGETSGQNTLGNTSSINLRGLGADKTLVLVNGRRQAGVNVGTIDYQTDINGIPLSAIERIEVLPSSASGIYGGSAVGGVVNVILKQDYSGGELRLTYDGYEGTSAAKRGATLAYGTSLEGGRTHLMFNASWADSDPLLLRDFLGAFERNLRVIQGNSPNYINSSTTPLLGSLPNILPGSTSVTTLTLQNGTALNSRTTYVPAGTSASTSSTDLAAGLLANAGQWKTDFPLSTQFSTGLLRRIGNPASTRSFRGEVRRQMLPWLELTGDFSHRENSTNSVYNPVSTYLTVPAAAPTNPFRTEVRVRVPDASEVPMTTRSQTQAASIGAVATLPWAWTGNLDYTWSESRFNYLYHNIDANGRTADLRSGALNPFVDTLLYPLDFSKYLVPYVYQGSSRLQSVALRGSGPLPALPWGQPVLTVGLEHRLGQTPERTTVVDYPVTVASSYIRKYYAQESTTDSAYAETTVPLVKKGWLPGLHALDLQLSGRGDRYEVDAGTDSEYTYYKRTPATVTYSGTTSNGEPFSSQASYASSNYTVGLKYQPVPDVTLRVSRATAFLPPTPTQLIKEPQPSTITSSVLDPVTGVLTDVHTLSGGNPDLKPEHSKSLNVGLIWEPSWAFLRGLRLNVEYSKIEQFDAIGNFSAQQIVNQESLFPERVTRDSSGTITLVDNSLLNLYQSESEAWDLDLRYSLKTAVGTFHVNATETITLHLKNQYALNQPAYDAVNFPSEDGAVKYKTNLQLIWERRAWTAGWSTRYFGSYKQYGAAGGPSSVQNFNGGDDSTNAYIMANGGDTIPSQTYHDVFVGYTFRSAKSGSDSKLRSLRASLLSGLSVQLNVRNVFDKVAPLDSFNTPYYLSPYGGGLAGTRSYLITLKKKF